MTKSIEIHEAQQHLAELVAQANSEGATLVSADAIFRSYPVRIAW